MRVGDFRDDEVAVEVCLFCRAVEYAVDTQNLNLSAIRTIRVLRPLRAINRIPSELIGASWSLSLPSLPLCVFGLLLFFCVCLLLNINGSFVSVLMFLTCSKYTDPERPQWEEEIRMERTGLIRLLYQS